MYSKRPKLPIAKEKLKLSLADAMKLRIENPAKLYKQLWTTIFALQLARENTPDPITAIADTPLIFDAQKGPLEASQTQSPHRHATVSRKSLAHHILQHSRIRSLQEDIPAGTKRLRHEGHASRPDP